MKYLKLIVIGIFLSGCSMPYTIDDRISYKTAALVKNEMGAQKGLKFNVDDGLKKYVLAQNPSSFTGGGAKVVINVGESLGGYIDQLYEKIYILEPARDINVNIKMKNSKADLKASGYASFAFKGLMLDYFSFDTTFEVDYITPNERLSKIYRYQSEKELALKEIDTAAKDTVVKIVLEDIATKLMRDIVKETNKIQ